MRYDGKSVIDNKTAGDKDTNCMLPKISFRISCRDPEKGKSYACIVEFAIIIEHFAVGAQIVLVPIPSSQVLLLRYVIQLNLPLIHIFCWFRFLPRKSCC